MFKFKELYELWRSDNLLTQALNDTYAMLESTNEMFRESVKSLRLSDDGEMGIDVFEKDHIVNKYEQEVRRKVLKHLVITGGVNIIPGLILTSIVIDIERIGDYTKNIMELAVAHPKRLSCGKYEEDIRRIEKGTEKVFEKIIPALKETDKDTARRLMKEDYALVRLCDDIVAALIKNEEPALTRSDFVTTALYVRYLKRIMAHLMNVASSVVNPFEGLGFREDEEYERK
ncbi:MAG: hypothetical protein GTO51_04785 [Candidatus Latescibacteria bacterium]|nr:hypothetical protein [Candidatus Latescibacterota bacterium]NIM21154.1 hypothetical protein [Candidatus Latescibacterota bacterium]NIM65289.1 hypothetical protein [Candidatus Latescibacterota bacterium]NIO01804.1 hypothetical protein [Candidatus Latescibacterota bacterium]NIO28321.1 hypothetical protein [Candidatus Latescibacterota bacterium]